MEHLIVSKSNHALDYFRKVEGLGEIMFFMAKMYILSHS